MAESRQNDVLVFIPTYNEAENVESICKEILSKYKSMDLLFIDDNSTDGTKEILERLSKASGRVSTKHREGKLGVGSAHLDGIKWAYDHGYPVLITMDCDFTHKPEDIDNFLQMRNEADVVVGSRFMKSESLDGWDKKRIFLTNTGHFITKYFLNMPYDATGGFRLYNLNNINKDIFSKIKSKSYSFFYESLFALNINNCSIFELPIDLPARTYGHSKMTIHDIVHSAKYVFILKNNASEYIIESISNSKMIEDWDNYWTDKHHEGKWLYDLIAKFYRKFIIRPSVNRFLSKYFNKNMKIIHAGSGGGQVDIDMSMKLNIIAMDISIKALNFYNKCHSSKNECINGDVFQMPFKSDSIDGIFNLGVMEHFTEIEINNILKEFCRVLKPNGKLIIYWPPSYGLSVIFLKLVHIILNILLKKDILLHPKEYTYIRSKTKSISMFNAAGFSIIEYSFGIRDFFTHQIIVAEKISAN